MNRRHLFRIVVPAFPAFNIYSGIARSTTAYGPVCVATSANKLDNWDVEVIDENNCVSRFCPLDEHGRPDHRRLQALRPAEVVGFYGGLTSTVPRLYQLAALYQELGAITITGGKHVENLPGEALANNLDLVVRGEGEETIKDVLRAFLGDRSWEGIAGLAFRRDGQVVQTGERPPITDFSTLPLPDFGLVRYANIKIYPLSRNRGCDMNCEFCAVKDKARCSTPERTMAQIAYLVETRGAYDFFESSDHFAAHRDETITFCRLLAAYQHEHGIRLKLTVQVRLSDARYPELLEAMKEAGIYGVCIGYESPIDEELRAMRKGYRSHDMLKWTQVYHDHGFYIHGMFMFGYPWQSSNARRDESALEPLPLAERVRRFQRFIRQGRIDTAQVLLTVPLPGTELRDRLERSGRLYPLEQIGWEYYDGQYPLFEPDDGTDPAEIQQAVVSIMSEFYSFNYLWRLIDGIILRFPLIVFPAAATLATLKTKYLVSAFRFWFKRYFRNQATRFGGHFIVKNWFRDFAADDFLERLDRARQEISPPSQAPASRTEATTPPKS
jgi:radical SAM superfamily enzyme YgiQ (UPF0313 family)